MSTAAKHDPDAGYEPAFAAPKNACDAHFHVFGREERYPYYAHDLRYKPPYEPLEAYMKLARRLGFETCNLGGEDLKQKAIGLFGAQPGYPDERCGARLYVDAVGVKAVLQNFAMLAPRNGELAVVGVHKEEAPLNWTQVCFNNWHIHGTGEGANEELLPEIVEMMKSGKYDLASLVTSPFFTGTFRSSRISTRLPASSSCDISRTFMATSLRCQVGNLSIRRAWTTGATKGVTSPFKVAISRTSVLEMN